MEPLLASAGASDSRRTLKSRSVAESTGGQSLLSSVRTGLDLDGLKWKKPWKSVQNIKGSMPSVITAVIEQAISDTRSFDHNADIVDKKVHDTYVVFVFNGEPDLTSYKNLKSVDVADLKTNTTRSIAIIDNHDDAANDVHKIIGAVEIVTDVRLQVNVVMSKQCWRRKICRTLILMLLATFIVFRRRSRRVTMTCWQGSVVNIVRLGKCPRGDYKIQY